MPATHSIFLIGCVNGGTSEEAIVAIERVQTDEVVHRVYSQFRDQPLVRWKDSYKQVLGIQLATQPGGDQ